MFGERTMEPILIAIFIILVVIAGYLMALPNILEGKGIDLKKLNAKISRKSKSE